MWVFGYGSLMWDGWESRHGCIGRHLAQLRGYYRAFDKLSVRNWGTRDHPCPTLNLKPASGAVCRGIAFEFADERSDDVTRYLIDREGRGFVLRDAEVQIEEGRNVTAFVPIYQGANTLTDTSVRSIAELVKVASGTHGPCSSYIRGILGQLSALQIDDPAVAELAREVGLEIPSLDRQRFLQARIFIYGDIAREIKLARTSESCFGRLLLKLAGVPHGGANFMAALSLLSYTEYAGRIKNNDFSDRNSRANFEDFFRDLGPAYESVMPTVDVYKVFRCGLAHEYYVKKDCTIAMRADNLEGAAIGYDGRRFFFVVENYFQDFRRAFDLLLDRSHGTT